jgi:hypothetical protein
MASHARSRLVQTSKGDAAKGRAALQALLDAVAAGDAARAAFTIARVPGVAAKAADELAQRGVSTLGDWGARVPDDEAGDDGDLLGAAAPAENRDRGKSRPRRPPPRSAAPVSQRPAA